MCHPRPGYRKTGSRCTSQSGRTCSAPVGPGVPHAGDRRVRGPQQCVAAGEHAHAPGIDADLRRHIRRLCGACVTRPDGPGGAVPGEHGAIPGQALAKKGRSEAVLRDLPLGRYDFVSIDGSHEAADMLSDAVLIWPLAKPGGSCTAPSTVGTWCGAACQWSRNRSVRVASAPRRRIPPSITHPKAAFIPWGGGTFNL